MTNSVLKLVLGTSLVMLWPFTRQMHILPKPDVLQRRLNVFVYTETQWLVTESPHTFTHSTVSESFPRDLLVSLLSMEEPICSTPISTRSSMMERRLLV